jgi:elongation factor 1-gamma
MSSSSSQTLYTYRQCFNTRIIQLLGKFTNTKLDIVYVDNMSENNVKKIVSKSPTGSLPLLQSGEFFLSGTIAITKYILSNDSNLREILIGKDNKRIALNDAWIDFTSYNVFPFYDIIIGQVTGKSESHQELFSTAISDLLKVLEKVNTHLTFRTFLVDHQVSLADLILAASLHPYFTLILDGKMRETIPNVMRWFLYVANIKELTSVLGKPRLCFHSSKPSNAPLISKPVDQKIEKKVEKKEEKKPQQKPQEKKVEQPKQQPAKPTNTPTPVEEEKKEKKKNPLDELPPTTLDLDSFKKDFLNTKDKRGALDRLWNSYDVNGWSIWFLHYNKSGDQGKIMFKTCNLKSNFLQVNFFNLLNFFKYLEIRKIQKIHLRCSWSLWSRTRS